jgi:hypothetical protein
MRFKQTIASATALAGLATGAVTGASGCSGTVNEMQEASPAMNNPRSAQFFANGFKVSASKNCSRKGPRDPACPVTVRDWMGNVVSGLKFSAPVLMDTTPTLRLLDTLEIGDDEIFTWPKTITQRDLSPTGELAKNMRQYTEFVGIVGDFEGYNEVKGAGAKAWLYGGIRKQQSRANYLAALRGPEAYCSSVVSTLVESLLPEGSEYRKYGNCGEGGRVAACLATKAGFRPDEIRVCLSENDHFFSMVKHQDPAKRWCLLDRWEVINDDSFSCEVDWDPATRVVSYKGVPMPPSEEWFQKVSCLPFDIFLRRGEGFP